MALIRSFGSEGEGLEFPLKEAISKEMLCSMFDEDISQDIYIFFENKHSVSLELPESYFLPEKEGKYVVVFEKAEKDTMRKLLLKNLSERMNPSTMMIPKTWQKSLVDVATVYGSGPNPTTMAIPLNTRIPKEVICTMFSGKTNQEILIKYEGEVYQHFSGEDLDKCFTPKKAGLYSVSFKNVEPQLDDPKPDNLVTTDKWATKWTLNDEFKNEEPASSFNHEDSVGQLDQNEFFDELNKRPTWETPHNQVDGNGSQEPDEAGSSSFSTSEIANCPPFPSTSSLMYGEDSHNYKWKQLRDIWDNDEEETSPKKKQTKKEEGGKAEDKKNQVAKEHPISNDWEFVEDETGPSSQA